MNNPRATWQELLGAIIVFRERLDRLDPDHTQPYTVPRTPATEADIAAFEQQHGEALPDEYRDFLLHADGWPCFYFRADLFGLPELRVDGHWSAAQTILHGYRDEGVLSDLGLAPDDVLPVCAGPLNMGNTLFLLVRTGRHRAGQVIWLDGAEVDRYPTFYDFVAATLDYLRSDVDKLQRSTGPTDS